MKISLPSIYYLSSFEHCNVDSDVDNYVFYMKDKEIYDNTLTIPFPYLVEHAVQFIMNHASSKLDFTIRDAQDNLIGCIGAVQSARQPHQATIGYWLAKPFWNKGIMTDVVLAFSNYCFEETNLLRLTATCFEHNIGSAKVLEKSGFKQEGLMIKHYEKDGNFYNGKMYGKVL